MRALTACLLMTVLTASGCTSCDSGGSGGLDSGTGDTDTDSDADTDSDTDNDTDTDTDTDSDSDTDSDTDTDSDAGPLLLPEGCEFVTPCTTNGAGWIGWPNLDNDHMVWRWIDSAPSPSEYVLMERTLSTGVQTEVLRTGTNEEITGPSVFNDKVFFERMLTPSVGDSKEIFKIGLSETSETQVTSNLQADYSVAAGENFIVYAYAWYPGGSYESGIKYYNLSTHEEGYILQGASGSWTFAFDGDHWVAFINDYHLYKFDLNNPGAGAQLMYADQVGVPVMAFNHVTGELVTGVNTWDVTNYFSIDTWDIHTNARTTVVDEEWDQVAPDAYGHVIAYFDSQATGGNWFPNQFSQIKIVDAETHVVRTITPHIDRHYNLAVWGRWLAFNNVGAWGDVLVLCDLREGGFIDANGHVCPDTGCPDPDAGVDGGVDGGK